MGAGKVIRVISTFRQITENKYKKQFIIFKKSIIILLIILVFAWKD